MRSSPPRVLLIDPNRDSAELYEWALQGAGFSVLPGAFDRPLAADVPVDAAVVYLRIPDEGTLRTALGGRRIPTLVLTGWSHGGPAASVRGCDALLVIPASPSEVVRTVAGLLAPAVS